MYSKYERRTDIRSYEERLNLYDGVSGWDRMVGYMCVYMRVNVCLSGLGRSES